MRPGRACQIALATAGRGAWAVALGWPALLHAQDVNLTDNLTNWSNASAAGALPPAAVPAPWAPALVSLPADWASLAAILIVLGVTAAYQLRKKY